MHAPGHRVPAIAGVLFALSLQPRTTAASEAVNPLSVVEITLGASPLHAIAGHGRLSAGFTTEGDVAVLTWPSPSCCDQLTHLSPNDTGTRDRPNLGVAAPQGIRLGLVIHRGAAQEVTWFRDTGTWRATAGYLSESALQPRFVLESDRLGLRAEVVDTVLPEDDVLQQRVRVLVTTGAGITGIDLLAYTNPGLTQNVVPRLPFGDVLGDVRNGFGAVWWPSENAVLHFRPSTADRISSPVGLLTPAALPASHFGPLDALLRTTDATAFNAGIETLRTSFDTSFQGGVYLAVATDPPAQDFTVGHEPATVCDEVNRLVDNVIALGTSGLALPLDPNSAAAFRCGDALRPESVARARNWTRNDPGAWADAQDGMLGRVQATAYLDDSALRTPMTLTAGRYEARHLLAFGTDRATVFATLGRARALTADAVSAADSAAWDARTSSLRLPRNVDASVATEDADRIRLSARRALLHLYAGRDRRTGALVASLARQAPYGLDWPRDGAFFSYALDVAGDSASVTRRFDWFLPLRRRAPLRQSDLFPLLDPAPPTDPRNGFRQYPEAAWEMNYYDTGEMGGFYRFEIDNTALTVWAAASHAAYVPESERRTYAQRVFGEIRASTDLLAAWRDPSNGLAAPAQEDDNAAFTASLHGGTTVFAALEAAARLARYLGENDAARGWEYRASELRDALVSGFYDAREQRFINHVTGGAASNPGSQELGPTAWLVWPARLLPYDDVRVQRQVRHDMTRVLASLRGDDGSDGGGYLTKTTLSAAIYAAESGDTQVRAMVWEALARIARDVMTPDTQVMGEVFITRRAQDGGVLRRENRVSLPHLWEATLFYLSAMALTDPGLFGQERRVFPAAQTPPAGTVVRDGGADASPGTDASIDGALDGGTGIGGGSACGCSVPGLPAAPGSTFGLLSLAAALAGTLRRRRTPSAR